MVRWNGDDIVQKELTYAEYMGSMRLLLSELGNAESLYGCEFWGVLHGSFLEVVHAELGRSFGRSERMDRFRGRMEGPRR